MNPNEPANPRSAVHDQSQKSDAEIETQTRHVLDEAVNVRQRYGNTPPALIEAAERLEARADEVESTGITRAELPAFLSYDHTNYASYSRALRAESARLRVLAE